MKNTASAVFATILLAGIAGALAGCAIASFLHNLYVTGVFSLLVALASAWLAGICASELIIDD